MLLNIANLAKTEHVKQLYDELADKYKEIIEERTYDPKAIDALKARMKAYRSTSNRFK